MSVDKLTGNPQPLDLRDKINQIIDNLVLSVNGSTKDEDGNIDVATIPVGFIYVQFPDQLAPADLFGGEWSNISSQYAGHFFRAEGGSAGAFGVSQGGGAPDITGNFTVCSMWRQGPAGAFYNAAQATRTGISGGADNNGTNYGFSASRSNGAYSINEFRPTNHAIRIWKRTK